MARDFEMLLWMFADLACGMVLWDFWFWSWSHSLLSSLFDMWCFSVWAKIQNKWKKRNFVDDNKCGKWEGVSIGALSPVSHKRLCQGWKQTSVHLIPIRHKNHETAKFLKIHKIILDSNVKQKWNLRVRLKFWGNNWWAHWVSPLLKEHTFSVSKNLKWICDLWLTLFFNESLLWCAITLYLVHICLLISHGNCFCAPLKWTFRTCESVM